MKHRPTDIVIRNLYSTTVIENEIFYMVLKFISQKNSAQTSRRVTSAMAGSIK